MPGPRVFGTVALGIAWLLPGLLAAGSVPAVQSPTGSAQQADPVDLDEPLAPLAFMAGCWRGDAYGGRGFVEERFTPAVGDVMLGTTRYVREGIVQLFEFHRIEARGNGVVLVPYPRGRESAAFRMASYDDAAAVFSNPDNDYPKRIAYRLTEAGELVSRIEGDEEDDAVEWRMAPVACGSAAADDAAAGSADRLAGVWRAETYELAAGATHEVRGRITFADGAWLVVFFVVDDEGTPRHGSAEGGTYSLDGDRLVFRHEYHLAGGEGVAGIPSSPLRLELRDAGEARVEPSLIGLEGERLTIHFPSGNRMTFRREPGTHGGAERP